MEGSLTGIAADAYVASGAKLSGDVRMASEASVFPGAIVNGEAAPVEIGVQANVQDNCVVEATPGHPVSIGERTTLGHNARVYGATVDARAMIAIGATVLAGAHVGRNAIVAANAVVPEGMQVPPRTLVIGQGRQLREVSEAEIQRIESGATEYARLGREYRTGLRS
ncbi:MAG TPA: gamma carbonic anhydrase family protein [Chloroflexota bacterium]|jgi:carbonic anhydrase/acetyltransferase-like protein (isoleucine patch superfamily)